MRRSAGEQILVPPGDRVGIAVPTPLDRDRDAGALRPGESTSSGRSAAAPRHVPRRPDWTGEDAYHACDLGSRPTASIAEVDSAPTPGDFSAPAGGAARLPGRNLLRDTALLTRRREEASPGGGDPELSGGSRRCAPSSRTAAGRLGLARVG